MGEAGYNVDFINSEHIGEYTEIEGCKLHYYTVGSGQPLLLLHAYGQSLYTWRELYGRLSPYFTVIAVDLPGFGYTKCAAGLHFDIESTAGLLKAFLAELGVKTTYICAASTGAFPALMLASASPQSVAALALNSPSGFSARMPVPLRTAAGAFSSLAPLLLSPGTVRSALSAYYFDQTRLTADTVEQYYAPYRSQAQCREAVSSIRAFHTVSTLSALRGVKCPVLTVLGREDKYQDKKLCSALSTALPESKQLIINNCGHIIQEEKPERLCAILCEFLGAAQSQY